MVVIFLKHLTSAGAERWRICNHLCGETENGGEYQLISLSFQKGAEVAIKKAPFKPFVAT